MRNLRPFIVLCFCFSIMTGCSLNFGSDEGEAVAVISGAPVVEIAAPLPNSTFLQGVAVNILAAVSNAGSDIQRVEIRVDEATIADVTSPNASGAPRFSITQTWTPDSAGEYTVTVTAYRADGSASQPATVRINVIEGLPTTQPTHTPQPTITRQAPTATFTIAPVETDDTEDTDPSDETDEAGSTGGAGDTDATDAPADTASGNDVVLRIVQGGINVRRGPSTNFVPPLGVLTGDVTALAANTSLTWFKINYQGGEAWITGDESLVTVISGDPASLPRESGPPIPTLAPPTATTAPPATGPGMSTVAPTGAATGSATGSATGADLVVSNFVLDPKDPFCNQPAQMRANIANIGNAATATGGFVILAVENTDGSNRQVLNAVEIPVLAAGASNHLVVIPFQDTHVSNRGDGIKRAIVIIDANNQIPEANDNNNSASVEFALGVPCQ